MLKYIALILFSSPALADFYAGGTLGQSHSPFPNKDVANNYRLFVLDRTGSFQNYYAGYRYKLMEIQGGYIKLPRIVHEAYHDGHDGNGARYGHEEITGNGLYLTLGARIPVVNKFYITPFYGFAFVKGFRHGAQSNTLVGYNESEQHTKDRSPYFGLRFRYEINKRVNFVSEISTIRKAIQNEHTLSNNFNQVSFGAEYKF